MLIAVAGTIGAGKSTVARAICDTLGVPLISIDDDKRAEGAVTARFDEWVASGTPFPDSFRTRAFDRTARRLAAMVDHTPHAVVEETFHRKASRDPFFDHAGALMGGFVLVEVVASETTILERLAGRARVEADHLAGIEMYQAFQRVSDPQDRTDHVFRNDGDFEVEMMECREFLQRRLGGGDLSVVGGAS